ncbi:LuxR C-terminal-related transcriptional regulator [Microbacterium sp. DT81.1]|uniref:LuxR C-terminal-related transcriptional regulator n=1 Tax=Microbacterium sp. DT81.1 TaxID=3393413 RepID=UPI003CFB2FD6
MTGLSEVSTPTSPQLDALLLDAKLAVPAFRPGFVSRSPLVAAGRNSAQRVVAITAPAGYGKTSLLAEWAEGEQRAVGWASLDRFDDDPVALLKTLASAFASATNADDGLVDDMQVHSVAALSRAAPRLASALRRSARPFVLIVDDLHVLTSAACHDVLSVVVGGIPAGSQLVAASRSTQPHVARSRASGDVFEIGAADLALDAEGARQIFRQARVPVTAELLDTVTVRTEGWPAGLHLAALIVRESPNAADVIVGEDRFVADYLYRESFSALPADTQTFLRRTAVLEHLTDDLCRVVAGSAVAGGLRALESSNVFLIPTDRTGEWYRYHPLYREFLLAELRRDELEMVPELHVRAADWYENRQLPAMAIDHLLQTPDRSRAVGLIGAVGLTTYQAGGMATVQRWLGALGDAVIVSTPSMQVLTGWLAVLSGDVVAAEKWSAMLDTASFTGEPGDGSASFQSARAMLQAVMCAGGPDRMLADAELAVAAEPSWSPWRDVAVYLAGDAQLTLGRREKAAEHFREVANRLDDSGNNGVRVLSHTQLAMIHMAAGRWDEVGELLDRARSIIEHKRVQDYSTSVLTFVALARWELHRGDLKAAERELTEAMRTRPVCTSSLPTVSVPVRIHLATAYWALGDYATARHLVREIDDILLRRPHLGVLVEQFEVLKSLVTTTMAGAQGGPPLTPAELRLLPYLQTHLTLPEIGARLFVSRNTVSTEVGSIYRKLGVSSRSEAVDRATAIGLLGG